MSKEEEVCANCDIPALDDGKLKKCACKLVKYCSDKCREGHREQHDEECQKRQTELHDRKLFTQPDGSNRGECPICFLPMPLDTQKYSFFTCCSTWICKGCVYADIKSNGGRKCPFCRKPATNREENVKRVMERVKANDPDALSQMGTKLYHQGDHDAAVEYSTKAAALGDADAHYHLSIMYANGEGVETDEEKKVYHLEQAAILSHPKARHYLACVEKDNGNIERSVKHLIIAANLGCEDSMKTLWGCYSAGAITKQKLEATLRTHKAALDEMKSPEREAARTE